MAEIFQEENAIVLAAAEKMVALGSEAAQRSILGKESKTQEAKGEKILRLLTAYRKKDDLTDAQLESILYCLRQASESNVFPTIDPIVGQNLEYLVQEEGGGSSALIMQNAGSDLPSRSYLNFYRGLTASDDGTRTNVGLTLGTDGYVLTMDSGLPTWLPVSGGHVIYNAAELLPLTQRDNMRFYNGLTASDNTPDTDVKWGGLLTQATTIDAQGFNVTFKGTAGAGIFLIGDLNTGEIFNEVQLTAELVVVMQVAHGATASGFTAQVNNPTNMEAGVAMINNTSAGPDLIFSLDITDVYGYGAGAIFKDGRVAPRGIEYAADYSATYSTRSLIDKGYADATYAPISGGAYWSLASGGTITGANTITSNTANQLNFTGTWTATANNQFMAQFGGALTATTTASDILNGYVFNPSITGGATNAQTIRGVTIQPTLTGGADNGDFTAALYVNPTFSGTFGAKFGILSLASLSTVYAGLRVQNSSTGSARLEILAENSSGINAITSMFSIERANGTNSNTTLANTGTGNIVLSPNGSTALTVKSGAATLSMETYGLLLGSLGVIRASGSMRMYYTNSNYGEVNTGTTGASGGVNILTGAQSATWSPTLRVTPGAHTSMTAATEFVSNDFVGASQQWLAGTVATQRFNYFRGFTVTGASATATFTDLYNVYIDANTVSTNAAATRSHALGLGGNLRIPADASATNGRIYLGSGNDNFAATAAITIASTNGIAAFQNWSAYSNNGSSEFRIGGNTNPGLDFVNFSGGATAATITRNFVRIREGLTSASAGVSYTSLSIIPTWNTTVSFNGTLIGLDYNPTNTSLTGATHLAIRTTSGQILFGNSSGDVVTASTRLDVRGTGTTTGNTLRLASSGNTATFTATDQGDFAFTQAAHSSGSPAGITFTGGAHTSLTASTEVTDIIYDLNRTVQFSTGAKTLQRAVQFISPTYASVAASAITDAATVAITGAPKAGSNITMSRSSALYIDGGAIGGGGGSAYGLYVIAPTGAGLGNFSAQFSGGTGLVFGQSSQASVHQFLDINQASHTGGIPKLMLVTAGSHTGLSATNEVKDFDFNLARTVQWATGGITLQRSFHVQGPTWAFVGASTITDGYTAYIGGPTQGTNATLTRRYALGLGDALGIDIGTTVTSVKANSISISAKDSSDGSANSTLALYLEQAPEATATFTQSHRLKVWINGTEYWLSLDAV